MIVRVARIVVTKFVVCCGVVVALVAIQAVEVVAIVVLVAVLVVPGIPKQRELWGCK